VEAAGAAHWDGIISGVGTAYVGPETGGISRLNRALISVARRLRVVAGVVKGVVTFAAPRLPDRTLVQFLGKLPQPDEEIMARPEVTAVLAEDLREAFRGGAEGVELELGLFDRPWRFELGQVSVPVHLWHGEADLSVPPASGHAVAAAIPDCRPVFIADAGHFAVVDLMDEVTATLFPS
jgi:pimeloyl-ACP methyl ester carboxylesterase